MFCCECWEYIRSLIYSLLNQGNIDLKDGSFVYNLKLSGVPARSLLKTFYNNYFLFMLAVLTDKIEYFLKEKKKKKLPKKLATEIKMQ